MRIEKAKKLLRENSEYNVSEIADQCGFCNYNYFITVFRRETGTTPRKYRKNAENKI
jgi:AraC-like DNA-binding protein